MRAYARRPLGRDLFAHLLASKFAVLLTQSSSQSSKHCLSRSTLKSFFRSRAESHGGGIGGAGAAIMNRELRIENLGPISSVGGMCAIIHIGADSRFKIADSRSLQGRTRQARHSRFRIADCGMDPHGIADSRFKIADSRTGWGKTRQPAEHAVGLEKMVRVERSQKPRGKCQEPRREPDEARS